MIDQAELGRRLRVAREAHHLTQEAVADHLGVGRLTYAHMELGKRGVSSLELGKLAYFFGRDMREFVSDDFQETHDPIAAIFRANDVVANSPEAQKALRDCLELGRELTNLEHLLGKTRDANALAAITLPAPTSRWDAVEQGLRLADGERRRLGLGWAPLGDMAEFIESQGIRVAVEDLPPDFSGIMLDHPDIGVFVVVNRTHQRERRRFSHAHEYAHALVDRKNVGLVSLAKDSAKLVEVRANAFAAAFLMPEDGVRQALAALGKGRGSRFQTDVVDASGVAMHVEGRSRPGSQTIIFPDVVELAHHFGVSRIAMLYRLKSLGVLDATELDELKQQDARLGKTTEAFLGLDEKPEQQEAARNAFRRGFLLRALEALRAERITPGKVINIATKFCSMSREQVEDYLREVGVDDDEGDFAAPPMAQMDADEVAAVNLTTA